MHLGVEAINAYVGRACLDVRELFAARGLDMRRLSNLMMSQKSVNLPCEDAVSNAVNAAKPLIDALHPDERSRLELVVVGTESGVDYAKPISTYVHDYLGLSRRCRSFEVKHACYGGTAALQIALAVVAGSPSDRKALVVAADAAGAADRNTYWEPSQGAGAVAMIVGSEPGILAIDPGASGYDSHEVMDTLRPRPDVEAGDSDLSLMSYLECLDRSFAMYRERVIGADIVDTFDYLVFHSPFAGMVKGAHRGLLRRAKSYRPDAIEDDFERRVADSLRYCTAVGNTYSAAVYLGLCSLVDHADFSVARRVGFFSYGSGCASEFYSGVVPEGGDQQLAKLEIGRAIATRYALSMPEYELVSDLSLERMTAAENAVFDPGRYAKLYDSCLAGQGLLVLDRIHRFHREYRWT